MTDLLLEKLGKAKSPWWVYLLVIAVTILVAVLKLKSNSLQLEKKVQDRNKETSEMEFRNAQGDKEAAKALERVRQASVKINSIDDKISEVDNNVKRAISRINAARSFKDLQS